VLRRCAATAARSAGDAAGVGVLIVTDMVCDGVPPFLNSVEAPAPVSRPERGPGWSDDWESGHMTLLTTTVAIAVLAAVVISLTAQRRQLSSAQMVGVRERHFELIKLMLEHPALDYNATQREVVDNRLATIGMSLWVAHWDTLWHIDNLDETALRFNLADLFADPQARAWWQKVGGGWSSKGSKRERRFIEIVTEECASALTARQ
jgi:hypothetical protein